MQYNRTCSQVSGCIIGHIGQVMSGYYLRPKNSCFLALSIYWLYQNFRSCMICTSDMVGFFQKLLEDILSIKVSFVYLLMLWKLVASAIFFSCLLRATFKNLIRPLYGCLGMNGHSSRQNQNRVEWAKFIWFNWI